MKIDVGLDEEVIGEQFSTIPEQHLQDVVRAGAFAQILGAWLKDGGQAKAADQKEQEDEK